MKTIARLAHVALLHAYRALQRGAAQSQKTFATLYDDAMAILVTASPSKISTYKKARRYLSRTIRARYGRCNKVRA